MNKIIILTLLVFAQITVFAQKRDIEKEMKELSKITDTSALNARLNKLKSGSENDLNLLLAYKYSKGQSMDALIKLALKRFPMGDIAFNQKMIALDREKNLVEKEKMLAVIRRNFPKKDFNYTYASMAGEFARAGQFDKALTYRNKTTGDDRIMAWAGMIYGLDQKYFPKAELLIDQELKKKGLDKKDELLFLSLKKYLAEKRSDYKNALFFAKKIMALSKDSSESVMDNYYYLLSKNGQYAVAMPGLKKAVLRETEDKNLTDAYKIAFQKIYPDRDFKAHIDSLHLQLADKYKAKYNKDSIAAHLIKENAPAFELVDEHGKLVKSEELKGKTLVLDFWATWCGPCKASLPGMQMLVNKYKADTTIKFLFVDTYEHGEDKLNSKGAEQALNYLKSQDLSLPLYLDSKVLGTNDYKVAKSFKVGGIPHKVVIDHNGFIRFNSIGFNGSTFDLVEELSAVINAVKN